MVLGLKTKNRKNTLVQLDYLIHVQEIKPWPPSQSLRTLRSVLIQWENGDRSSGSTNSVVPSHGSVIGEGKIEFNESFRLPVTLLRDLSIKAADADTFQKNCLEFNLYELRRDNSVKGQLLGTAIIDLADYGVVKETLNTSVPMNCKRSFSNMATPVLSIKIQPVDKGRTSSSSRDSLSKEESLAMNGGESVSALMNEEYAEEAELASLTDDDVSSHSFVIISSAGLESNEGLPPQKGANGPDTVTDSTGGNKKGGALTSKMGVENSDIMPTKASSLFSSSSLNLSSDLRSPVNGHASISNPPNSSPVLMAKDVVTHSFHSFTLSSSAYEYEDEESNPSMRSNGREDLAQDIHEKLTSGGTAIGGGTQQSSKENKPNSSSAKVASPDSYPQVVEKGSTNSGGCLVDREDVEKAWRTSGNCMEKLPTTDDICNSSMGDKDGKKQQEHGHDKLNLEEKSHSAENELVNSRVFMCSDTVSSGRGNLGMNGNILKSDRLKHVKSVRSPLDSARSNGLVSSNQNIELKEVCVPGNSQNNAGSLRSNERKDAKIYPDTRSAILDCKIQQLEHKINMLEGELREAAAIEAALYSIVAEHGSSMSKVHTPARRLSRLYLHACKESSQSRRASAARSAVSGLVLVAKACGNDVPRLTFWLSNSVVLRVIIGQTIGDLLPLSAGPPIERNGGEKGYNKRSSPLKWKELSSSQEENKNILYGSFGDWEDPHTFISALERVEAWIFSRIVESIWWQTLTPHMQSAAANTIDRVVDSGSGKNYGRNSSSCEQDQDYFSLDLWRNAFKDAFERLCPVRAGGHECGCLPVLAKLIMEQCVSRLDVAMFNAILRESADEIPTDPVSDPISDSKVLPIPAGKSSFGAGAQLKNVIGNWSRWLTDLFGMDDGNSLEDENELDGIDERQYTSFKLFYLLNALSDLMMLPKDMLLGRSIRKEVCPTFGATLIKRVLYNFVPDEFCPDPIPDVVLEALDSEDPLGVEESSVTDFPCLAASTVYLPPSAASCTGIVGKVGSQSQLMRSGSSVLRKSYTSDDELEELYSPLASIFIDGSQSSPVSTKPSGISKEGGNQNAFSFRYELLRDVWMNDM